MNLDTKAIKAAAEAATQGNWWVTAQGKHVVAANEGRVCAAPEHMAQWNWNANAKHIATANPATVSALCDEIERLFTPQDPAVVGLAIDFAEHGITGEKNE